MTLGGLIKIGHLLIVHITGNLSKMLWDFPLAEKLGHLFLYSTNRIKEYCFFFSTGFKSSVCNSCLCYYSNPSTDIACSLSTSFPKSPKLDLF